MNILVVSPHPDDETLGAGGTICRFIDEGHNVYWLNVTSIENNKNFTREIIERRKQQLVKIQEFYGFDKVYHLNFPTTKLEEIDSSEAIGRIAEIVKIVEPQVLILPDYNDAHSDHKRVFDWCHACAKTFRYPFVKQIMTMEILSETDFGRPDNPFIPNFFIDISKYMDKKIEAMKIYDTELGEFPFPRSIKNMEALATLRGAMCGTQYAEGFRLIKMIY